MMLPQDVYKRLAKELGVKQQDVLRWTIQGWVPREYHEKAKRAFEVYYPVLNPVALGFPKLF